MVDFDVESPEGDLTQAQREAAEAGVDDGIRLAEEQGVTVTVEQREAITEAAIDVAMQHQNATAEQIQGATTGALHGALLQHRDVNVTQLQSVVNGSADGALAQHRVANVTQLQSAAWGASHGALAQHQVANVTQLQFAARGAASGAAMEAGEKDLTRVGAIQEAAQGAAHGALDGEKYRQAAQYQAITVEQIQHAAAGAAVGVLDGMHERTEKQHVRADVEQVQHVSIKQIQKAAMGSAKGALVQRQAVTVEQTQAAARGAGKGSLTVTQIQRVTAVQIQKAAFGSSKGAIYRSQVATVEQIHAAALGSAEGVLVQRQQVSVEQIQHAAIGSAKGAVAGAVQHHVVRVEQIQQAAKGAGEGSVVRTQDVSLLQVQIIAQGAAEGVLAHADRATTDQVYSTAKLVCAEVPTVVVRQRITITQIQRITIDTASDTVDRVTEEDVRDEREIADRAREGAEAKRDAEPDVEGDASITFADQRPDGQTVTVDSMYVSEGGFVAIHDASYAGGDTVGSVIGVSEYLGPGTHEDIEVALFEDVPGAEFDPEELGVGTHTLFAIPYHDVDDDRSFEFVATGGDTDWPYIGDDGHTVLDSAAVAVVPAPEGGLAASDQPGDGDVLTVDRATANVDFYIEVRYGDETSRGQTFPAADHVSDHSIELRPPIGTDTTVEVAVVAAEDDADLASQEIEYRVEEPDPTASVLFEGQESDGTSVEVASISLDEGGFVAIHENGELPAEEPNIDAVIGVSEYLEPGDHEDVDVTLFEDVPGVDFDREALEDGEHDLTAIAHRDTDDTRSFTYVESVGEEDEPYMDDEGDPIADDALVAVEDDPTAIDSCTVIDEPGYYELTRDLEDRSGLLQEDGTSPAFFYDRVCIAIRTSDVVLEGNGHLVDGVGADSSVGINVYNRDEDLENVTVRNLRVEDWHDGLEAGRAYVSDADVRFENVEAIDNAAVGIRLGRAHESTLENVTARENAGAGISLYQTGDAAIRRSSATGNGAGISIGESGGINLQDVVANENDGTGVSAGVGSGHHTFENVSADRNGGNGFLFQHSDEVEISQSTAVGNGGTGILIDGQGEGHQYTDVTISDSGEWDVDVREGEATGTALGLGDELTIEFSDEAAAIGAVDRNDHPILPENVTVIGDGIELDGVESVGATFDSDESAVKGDEIELWRHDGSEWSSVDTFDAPMAIETELTEDGVYTPVEIEETPAEFTISDPDPMTVTVDLGEPFEVSATVENVGDEAGTQTIELQIDDAVADRTDLDVEPGESATVEFENVSTADLEPGEYEFGIASEDDEVTGTLFVEMVEPADFVVSALDPPEAELEQGEPFEVSATVENVGDETATQTVQLEIGAVVDLRQTVTLDGGESQIVTFANVDTGALDPGNYQHVVSTEDGQVSGTITIQAEEDDPASDDADDPASDDADDSGSDEGVEDPEPEDEGDPDSEEGDEDPGSENGNGSDAEDETDGNEEGVTPDQIE